MLKKNRWKYSVLVLSALVVLLLLIAAIWTKSTHLNELPPFLEVGGNLHPLLLHLPIGIFVYLAFAEAWNLLAGRLTKRLIIPGSLPILAFGTVFAVFAAVAGLLLYLQGDYSGELIDQHLNWGIGFAVAAIITFCGAIIFKTQSAIYRTILFASVIVLWAAAHRGGLITHGDPLEPLFAEEVRIEDVKPVAELTSFEVVDRIFQAKCYDCHSTGKKKRGGLLMDSYEALLAGGRNGNALVPGDLEASRISTYAHLPIDDDLRMPPEGKPQLTETELEFIDQWILAGASPDQYLSDQALPKALFEWALSYMKIENIHKVVEVAAEQLPALPIVDFVRLIADIERYAEKSVMRVGPEGRQLIFSAVNAREQFTDEAVKELIKAGPYLIDVDLSNTAVTSNALQKLTKETPHLERLNLSGTTVDAQLLAGIAELPELESLNLFNTPLTEEEVSQLIQLNQVDKLYVTQTGLSSNQVERLRNALPVTEIVADDFIEINEVDSFEAASVEESEKKQPVMVRAAGSGDLINLAFGKPVTASSYYNSPRNGQVFEPENITDGRLADTGSLHDWSFWIAETGDSGQVTIDLEQTYTVSRIDLQNTRNRQYFDRGIKDFVIEVSSDGSEFAPVLKGTLQRIEEMEPASYRFESFKFPPTKARYIRIHATTNHKPVDGRHDGSGGLNEVRIYYDPTAKIAKPDGDHGHDQGHVHDETSPAPGQSHVTGYGNFHYRSDPDWANSADANLNVQDLSQTGRLTKLARVE
ncbi:MAG: discoidin domain-containing protein [Verrucomicrobiota bacterium]